MTDATTPIASLRQLMQEFVTERHWQKYHLPKNLAASVSIEAAELLELFQWLTPEESSDRPQTDPAFRQALADEMADVLCYLLSLANAANIDLAHAVEQKMAKNRLKYPPEKFQGTYQRPLNP